MDAAKYIKENFIKFDNGEYRKAGLKLWWTDKGYQIDNTGRLVTTKDELIEELYLSERMKFGKYVNKRVRNIEDLDYLKWVLTVNITPNLQRAVKIKIKRIEYYAK